ncbi:MAG: hypothetical protein LUE98_16915, partial [Tannerellaceae bacterium]|nr:hypothetical protein [Tannerellaceae bacterium]
YYNLKTINTLDFEKESMEWFILDQTNDQVLSFDCLFDRCVENFTTTKNELRDTIIELRKEKLMYVSSDYNELLSIVYINRII